MRSFLKNRPDLTIEKFNPSGSALSHRFTQPHRSRRFEAEETFPEEMAPLEPGDRRFHKDFGIGQVQEVYDGSLGLTYKIIFEREKSLKTLVAKYANLNRI